MCLRTVDDKIYQFIEVAVLSDEAATIKNSTFFSSLNECKINIVTLSSDMLRVKIVTSYCQIKEFHKLRPSSLVTGEW